MTIYNEPKMTEQLYPILKQKTILTYILRQDSNPNSQ